MRFSLGGRSFKNGIDFNVFCGKSQCIISSRRDEFGKVTIKDSSNPYKFFFHNKSLHYLVSFVFAIVVTLVNIFVGKTVLAQIVLHLFVVLIFLGTMYVVVYFLSKDKDNEQALKYHAAEHMAINYFIQNEKAPKNIEELKKVDMFSVFCGQTLSIYFMLIIASFLFIFKLVPGILLKILLSIASIFLLTYFWLKGKLDFNQRLTLKTPTETELEVAFEALKKIENFVKSNQKEER